MSPLLRYTPSGIQAADHPRLNTRRIRSRHAWTQASREQRRRVPYCQVCGATTDLTADHLQPLAAGGRMLGPLATLCRKHNSSRGAG